MVQQAASLVQRGKAPEVHEYTVHDNLMPLKELNEPADNLGTVKLI